MTEDDGECLATAGRLGEKRLDNGGADAGALVLGPHGTGRKADPRRSSLGPAPDASEATEEQLRLGGDKHTRVPGQVTSPGHSAPGQATWELADQATFTSNLPCLPGSSKVTEPMGRVSEEQQWGLGQVDGARFKGGWGEVGDGFIVRQLGLLPGAKGDTAVTLQMRTTTFEDGIAIADELGTALKKHQSALPTGTCS